MHKRRYAIGIRIERLLGRATLLVVVPSIVFVLAYSWPLRGQSQTQNTSATAPIFEYEVASIKLNKSGGNSITTSSTPDSLTIENVPLKFLIQSAYGVQNYQILGAPDWLISEHYDVDAKADPSVADAFQKLSLEDRRIARQHMLQALLADRFKLKVHVETRDLPVYSLLVAKNGPKLQETKVDNGAPAGTAPAPIRGGPSIRTSRTGSGPVILTVFRCTGADLATLLASHVGRPVLDKTGLTSRYDFILQFTAEDSQVIPQTGAVPSASDPIAPSIFTAVQEQLGLKLESGKGPVAAIVIDHVERPSGN